MWCLLLLGAYLSKKSKNSSIGKWFPGEKVDRLYGSDFEDMELPRELHQDVFEKSFAARSQNDIRLPFGANPQVKHIENFQFFDNERFRKNYQAHLHTAWIENNDWRLDKTTNSILTQYSKPHNPEKSYERIGQYCEKRHRQRGSPSVYQPEDFAECY